MMDTILMILLGILCTGVVLFIGIIALIVLSIPFKVVYRLYEWFFTSYGQMAQVRWKQGDFTDYRNYWPWNW